MSLNGDKENKQLPKRIVDARKKICGNCQCNLDFTDPLAACPKNNWIEVNINYIDLQEKEKAEQKFPTKIEMLRSFTSAVADEIRSFSKQEKLISQEEIDARLSICKSCEFFRESSSRCVKCGCFLKVKTMFKTQSCPIGKWKSLA